MPWDDDERRFRQVDKTVVDLDAAKAKREPEPGPPAKALAKVPRKPEEEAPTTAAAGGGVVAPAEAPTDRAVPREAAPAQRRAPEPIEHEVTTKGVEGERAAPPAEPSPAAAAAIDTTKVASPRHAGFFVPERFRDRARRLEVLVLSAAGKGGDSWRLVARDEFRLGRSSQEVDFATWFLPRSARNDALTRRISRVHTTLVLDRGRMWISDCGTTNGTAIEGAAVKERTEVRGVGASEVVLAGEYRVVVEALPVAFSNLEVDALPEVMIEEGGREIPCGAVCFHAVDGPGPDVRPLWLLGQAAFGKSRGCAVRLKDESLDDVQGVFCRLGGVICVANLAAQGEVALNNSRLLPGEVAPLVPGDSLQVGENAFAVEAG